MSEGEKQIVTVHFQPEMCLELKVKGGIRALPLLSLLKACLKKKKKKKIRMGEGQAQAPNSSLDEALCPRPMRWGVGVWASNFEPIGEEDRNLSQSKDFKNYHLVGTRCLTSLIPVFGKQGQAILWIPGQPGLQSRFQDTAWSTKGVSG